VETSPATGAGTPGPRKPRRVWVWALLAALALGVLVVLGLPKYANAPPAAEPPSAGATSPDATPPSATHEEASGTGAAARPAESDQSRKARALIARGQAQYHRGDYDAASASFRRALQVDPGNPDAQAGLRRAQVARQVAGSGVLGVLGSSSGGGGVADVLSSGSESPEESRRAEQEAERRKAEEMWKMEQARRQAEKAEGTRQVAEAEAARQEEEAEAKKSVEGGGGPVEAVPVPAIPAPTPVPSPPHPVIVGAAPPPREGAAPPSTAAPSEPPPQYQRKAEYEFPADTVEGNLEKPPGTSSTLERFPTIESPDAVAPEQEFAVQISLTEEQITPEAKVQQGATTAEGKVVLNLPAAPEQQQWKIDVALSAPGLDFARGSNMGSIVLPRQGDSTVAIFYLRARAIAGAERPVHLMATLWYQGSYLARIERDLVVRNPQGVAANQAMPPAQAGAPAAPPAAAAVRSDAKAAAAPAARSAQRAAAEEAAPAASPVPQQRRAALDLGFVPPDLTVVILGNAGDNTSTVIIESPHLQPAQYTVPRARGLGEWLAAQYRQIAARSSRGMQSAGEDQGAARDRQSTDAFLKGFGRQLYLQFAPAPFQQAFWTLEDKLGPKFRTIQIFTDDPTLPWELMRPVRSDGSGERDFLGMEFSVARWHVTQDAAQMERPPQTEPLEQVVVIAPQYKGESALAAQSSELSALQQFPGYSALGGDMEALRGLFQQLPQGMVHFAGHGAVAQQGGSPEYAILLEDGPLDLMTWRGMTPLRQRHHPVFFFNACEVGQSQKVANFVDGWAPAVLRSGASGYIGALWPVNDRVAALFAARFYQGMERDLAGAGGRARVSEVLTETRREVFRETGDPTALAYVFYGDPNLAFSRAH
jgi:tetratricopeptide (TPR) repeat protein